MNLLNKNVCITGKLSKMQRFNAFKHIQLEGGTPKNNMNNTIDILVVSDTINASNKIRNINNHCQIISESQFYQLIGA